ncbi:helix-turn-helix domain-containing protein [Streptomyces griseoflavus]|uniref:helix-turn-helix domain-containing protein n=1 Tax=Streptomyces griseoflavus TaxID=35619 RepID=UPI0034029A1E
MSTQSRPKTQISDPTGKTVADNVRRIRGEVRGWSTYELSRKLSDAGRPIAASALAKVERGERRVDVGDLMALAVALEVNPAALLFPPTINGEVELTGGGRIAAAIAWEWAEGERPLKLPQNDDGAAHNAFQTDARPAGRRKFVAGPVSLQATAETRAAVQSLKDRYREQTGEELDDNDVLRLMFGASMEGGADGPSVD